MNTNGRTADSLSRNTLWATLGQLSTVGLQALYFIVIGRTLGSYDYGLFVGIYSLVAVLSPYSTLGFGMVMLRDVSRDPQRLPSSWGKALSVLGIGSIVVTLLTLLVSHFLFHRSLVLVVLCLALSESFCARAIELAGQAYQALHQLAWTARFNTMMGLARTLAAISLALYCAHRGVHASVLLWALIYTGFSFLSMVFALAVVHLRLVKPQWCRISRRECSEGLSFALSNSSFSIYNDFDKTMLASYGFIQAAGTYAAAYRIIEVATAPIRAIYAAAMPRIFEYGSANSGGGIDKVMAFVRRLLKGTVLYAVVTFLLLVWLAPYLPAVLGKSYTASVPAVRMLALIPLLRCFHYAAGNAISGCTSQWYRTSAQLFAAVLNLGLNLVLIPHYSWKGAAIASLITDGSLGLINWATFLYLHHAQRCRISRALQATP